MQGNSQYCRKKSYLSICELDHLVFNQQVLMMCKSYLRVHFGYAFEVLLNKNSFEFSNVLLLHARREQCIFGCSPE
jgi:hypothetical protein